MSAAELPTAVTVHAPARLHLGFLNPAPGPGRRFGSIGLALADLGITLAVRRAPHTSDVLEGPHRDRARACLARMREELGLPTRYRLDIASAVPAHAGLGSGTQIALAVAAGLRRLEGRPLDIRGDAARLNRGARSGLGIALFAAGGLIVDGGRGVNTVLPAPVSRLEFPERWRILLVLDQQRHGHHGPAEAAAFAALAPLRPACIEENCRLVLLEALPAVLEQDLAAFGGAIAKLQGNVGDYFAAAQGGRFMSPAVAAALEQAERRGAVGIGQSSWGPTGFAFAESAERAAELVEPLRRARQFAALDIRICRGLNCGAQISPAAAPGAPAKASMGAEPDHA